MSAQPTHLSFLKAGSSSFHVAWIYYSSGYYLKSFTTDFSSAPSAVTSAYTMPTGVTPSALFSRNNSATLSDLYIASNSGAISKSQYNASTPGLSTPQIVSNVKYIELQTPYCFSRSRAIATRPTLGASPQTSGCNLPESSYAPAIRNTLMVDHDNDGSTPTMDHGFKQDIQSLNPATFKSLFTLP